MEIRKEQKGKYAVVHMEGMITGPQSESLLRELMGVVEDGCYHIALNMESLSMIDSAGIGAFVYTLKHIMEHDGAMVIVGANSLVDDMLHTTNTVELFELYKNMEEFEAARVEPE